MNHYNLTTGGVLSGYASSFTKHMKIAASIFGIGYIGKGGGTLAALVAAVSWYFLPYNTFSQFLITAAVVVLGILSGNVVEKQPLKEEQYEFSRKNLTLEKVLHLDLFLCLIHQDNKIAIQYRLSKYPV